MQLQIPEPLGDSKISVATYVTGFVATIVLILFLKRSDSPNLEKIPTVGANTWLGSWWAGVKFLIDATDVMQEGYDKYKGTPFKVSGFFRWIVVISGRQHVEEFCKCRDDELNLMEALNETLKTEHTLGHDVHYNPYHIAIIRSKLLRNLGALYGDIHDEIVTAFDEILNLEGHEWKSIPAFSAIEKIVCRSSNRIFVGLPLCRNPDWVHLSVQFTLDVIKAVAIISLFPKFMAPFVARFLTNVSRSCSRGVKYLAPIVAERREHLEEYGSPWADKPNDLLSWLMEVSESSRRPITDLTSRVLAMSFAAIHTSSNSFTQALYNLVANPQYIPALREEVELIVKEEGWSKAALAKMHKVDSFMKEVQRMHGVTLMNVMRKAMKDVTFSDGIVIPKGTHVMLATQSMHLDNELYDNAATFDPFRFANMRGTKDRDGVKYQSATTSPEYLVFGHGRHSCPGRFFTMMELNTMLAHLILSYDIKLEENASRPRDLHIGTSVVANPTARVMFRSKLP